RKKSCRGQAQPLILRKVRLCRYGGIWGRPCRRLTPENANSFCQRANYALTTVHGSMLPFTLIYRDDYLLPIGTHVFPAGKYRGVHDRLLATAVAETSDFLAPDPASDQDVLLVHTPQYVQKLKTGTLTESEEMQMEIPYSPELVNAFWLAAGGSILAASHALRDRVAINIGGGFHH